MAQEKRAYLEVIGKCVYLNLPRKPPHLILCYKTRAFAKNGAKLIRQSMLQTYIKED